MLEQEEGKPQQSAAPKEMTVKRLVLTIKTWRCRRAHLVLAFKVNNDIIQREASFLTQASQHIFDWLAVASGSQRGAAIWEVDAAVTPVRTSTSPNTLLRETGTQTSVLQHRWKGIEG